MLEKRCFKKAKTANFKYPGKISGKELTNGQVTIFIKVPEGRMRSEHRFTV